MGVALLFLLILIIVRFRLVEINFNCVYSDFNILRYIRCTVAIFLNIGAGFMSPLNPNDINNIIDFANLEVINLDIYNHIVPYTPDRSKIPFPNHDIRYSDCQRNIALDTASVDAILAVNPYGYSVLNAEVYRVLKSRGLICILGSNKNKFVSSDAIRESDLPGKLGDLFELEPTGSDVKSARLIIPSLMQRKSYVTSGDRETKIDIVRLFRKI